MKGDSNNQFLKKLSRNKLFLCIASAVAVSLILSVLLTSSFLKTPSERLSDALYSEAAPFSEIIVLSIDDKSISEIGRWPWSREVFAKALEKLVDAKVVGVDVSFLEEESAEADSSLQEALSKLQGKVVLVSECTEFEAEKCQKWLFPIFNVTHAAANVYTEHGVAVATPEKVEDEKSFSKVVAETYLNKEVDLKDKNYIKFTRPQKVSFSDFVNNAVDPLIFKDKIVLIGATAKDLHDEQETPIGVLSGIEIHASAVQSIVAGKFLEKQSQGEVTAWIAGLSLIIALALYYLSTTIAAILALLLIVAYSAIAVLRFDAGGVYNLLYPALSVIATYFAVIGTYYIAEAREHKWIRSVFSKYVSDNVAKEIMEMGADALKLKGSKKTVTVLFADVRGFTSMSEKLPPEKVVAILNKYLSKMTDVVFKNNGTLDKYVGDEVMATYNVPLDQKDHALNAVKTGLEMQQVSKSLGNLKYGIGINTGPAIVGNIGSERRLDYTVIGDSVNLGARLCSKAEGDKVLISESTYQLVKDRVKVKPLGEITVKGKEKPIKVYSVLSLK